MIDSYVSLASAERRVSPLQTRTGLDFAGQARPRAWIVEGWVPDQNVTLFQADGGDGKSTIALQLAIAAVVPNTPWLGRRLSRHGPVLFLTAEDDYDEVHRRLESMLPELGVHADDLGDLHVISLAGENAIMADASPKTGAITGTALFDRLKVTVEAIAPALIVLDTLADVYAGDENRKAEVRTFIAMLRGLAMEAKSAVILIAHPSLSGMASGTGTSGNVAWSNSVRSRIYMTRPRDTESKQVVDADARVLEVMKANYAPAGQKMAVRYQNGCFVPTDDVSPKRGEALDEEARYEFLNLLAQFEREGRTVSHNQSSAYAPSVFAKHPAGRGIAKGVYARAMDRLLADGRIRIVQFGPPSKLRHKLVEVGLVSSGAQ